MKTQISHLLEFMTEHGITMNAISIDENQQSGMHIKANGNLRRDDVVAKIPKSCILSTKTTAIADVLEENQIGGLLGLSFALMFEKAKGVESPWYDYIKSMPEKVDIPLLWDDEELGWLNGTELGDSVSIDKIALVEDYESIIFPIVKDNSLFRPIKDYSFEKFKMASSLVSSRAFNVDDYHQQSMVPLADVFNHSWAENVHFQCNSTVCEFCGESGICDCDILSQIDEIEEKFGSQQDDEIPSLNQDHELEEQYNESEDVGMMEMVIIEPRGANEEVFNTYGQHSNSYLLNRYGFCEPNNPYDTLNFDKEEVMELIQELPVNHLSARLKLWETIGRKLCHRIQKKADLLREVDLSQEELEEYMEEDEEEDFDDEFYLEYTSDPSFGLYCFLQLILMKSDAFKIYMIKHHKFEAYLSKLANQRWNNNKGSEDTLLISVPMKQFISQLCLNRLKKYSTTLQEDIKLYKTVADNNLKLKSALILRISDKEIIRRFLDKSGP